jgi:hypothetical protein
MRVKVTDGTAMGVQVGGVLEHTYRRKGHRRHKDKIMATDEEPSSATDDQPTWKKLQNARRNPSQFQQERYSRLFATDAEGADRDLAVRARRMEAEVDRREEALRVRLEERVRQFAATDGPNGPTAAPTASRTPAPTPRRVPRAPTDGNDFCVKMRDHFHVVPEESWGSLPNGQQLYWTRLGCNQVVAALDAAEEAAEEGPAAGTTVFAAEDEGGEGGTGRGAATATAAEGGVEAVRDDDKDWATVAPPGAVAARRRPTLRHPSSDFAAALRASLRQTKGGRSAEEDALQRQEFSQDDVLQASSIVPVAAADAMVMANER